MGQGQDIASRWLRGAATPVLCLCGRIMPPVLAQTTCENAFNQPPYRNLGAWLPLDMEWPGLGVTPPAFARPSLIARNKGLFFCAYGATAQLSQRKPL